MDEDLLLPSIKLKRRGLLAAGLLLPASRALAGFPHPSIMLAPNAAAAVVFSTWNPSDKSASMGLSGGNLAAASTASNQSVRGTASRNSGKLYFEFTFSSANLANTGIGCLYSGGSLTSNATVQTTACIFKNQSGNAYSNGSSVFAGSAISSSSVVSIAVDFAANKFYTAVGGVWDNSANPGAGTGSFTMSLAGNSIFPWFFAAASSAGTLNVGASAFTYSIPSGFSAWQ